MSSEGAALGSRSRERGRSSPSHSSNSSSNPSSISLSASLFDAEEIEREGGTLSSFIQVYEWLRFVYRPMCVCVYVCVCIRA